MLIVNSDSTRRFGRTDVCKVNDSPTPPALDVESSSLSGRLSRGLCGCLGRIERFSSPQKVKANQPSELVT